MILDNTFYNLLCDIENYLVQKIDADENYHNYDSAEQYLMATDPNMYELYKILLKIYDNVETLCKILGICRLTYTRNVNKKIFKLRKLNTYVYIETLYGKENI